MKIRHSLCAILAFSTLASAYGAEVSMQPRSVARYSSEFNSVLFDPSRNEYQFNYQKEESSVLYSMRIRDPYVEKGLISLRAMVDENRRVLPLRDAGLLVRGETGQLFTPSEVIASGTSTLLEHKLVGDQVHFLYEDIIAGRALRKEYRIGIQGKTLIINASSSTVSNATTGYIGFDFSPTLFAPDARIHTLPSSPFPVMRIGDSHFMSTYVDPLISSTHRYETTSQVENIRKAQASNTPAWLIEDVFGTVPHLNITAYLTLSDDLLDVLPVPAKQQTAFSQELRKRVVIDLSDSPMAQAPRLPLEIIRAWEAPASGLAQLEGSLALQNGDRSIVEVRLLTASGAKEPTLFSQALDRAAKPITGIEGSFPLAKGDRLLFVVTGPSVMRGGNVALNLKLAFNGARFDSIDSFSDEQGHQNWYYLQKRGSDITPLLWNDAKKRWESHDTRSWISQDHSVCRAGRPGDVFLAAKRWMNEIHSMGMSNLLFIVDGWQQYAVEDALSPSESSPDRWGASKTLQRLADDEIERGNMFAARFPYDQVKEAAKKEAFSLVTQTLLSDKPSASTMDEAIANILEEPMARLSKTMRIQALLADRFPHHESLYRFSSLAKTYGHTFDDSALYSYLHSQSSKFLQRWQMPLLIQTPSAETMLNEYWAGFGAATIQPLNLDNNAPNYVREDLDVGRVAATRIGVGSYAQFFQEPDPKTAIDPRTQPLDQYRSATVAFGRIPLISDRLYHPAMTRSEWRKSMLESYSLLSPVALEYLDPSNTVANLEYETESGTRFTSKGMMFLDQPGQASRIVAQYRNGLKVYVNRSSRAWNVQESFLPLVNISKDGFLAVNESTGLVSIIGELGDRSFSAARANGRFFLHSREGVFLRIPPLGTDGMVSMWNAPFEGRRDMACIQVSEVMQISDVSPLIRFGGKADFTARWLSGDSVDIWIMDTQQGEMMMEFYDLPQEWLVGSGSVTVTERAIDGSNHEAEKSEWSLVSFSGALDDAKKQGIRIPRIQSGHVYTISAH